MHDLLFNPPPPLYPCARFFFSISKVVALEYHPKEDVVATAAEQDGAFNLWGLRRTNTALESLAAAATKAGGGGGGERGEGTPEVHWACSLSVSGV